MGARRGSGLWQLAALAATLIALAAHAGGGAGTAPRVQITVWSANPPASAFGGTGYGGVPTGAQITEQREVDVAAGELRLTSVATTIDPASVQLRDLSEPGAEILEQRFVPGAATPTELLARHVGEPVTVATAKAEVTGVLRAVDDQSLVVEVGAGDQRHLQLMRRDGYVQDVRLSAAGGPGGDKPTLIWRLRTARPGVHTVELGYRADGLSWTASYLGVLDEPGKQLEFSARATIQNATGTSFDAAQLTLLHGGVQLPLAGTGGGTPARYPIATPVRLGAGEAVQVELMPRRTTPVRPVILFEAMPDPSSGFQARPGTDCNQLNGSEPDAGHAEIALELDVPVPAAPRTASAAGALLPDGKVRLYRRRAAGVELVTEGVLRTASGLARIRVAPATDITGARHATRCNFDEHARTIQEAVEVVLENKSRQPADVIVREHLWRWPSFRLDAEDHKGVRAGPQTQEYRVHLAAGSTQRVTYTAMYAW